MLKIQFPPYDFKIKEEDSKEWIFDAGRKKWVRLTPEEWVRQNFMQYLLQVKEYPAPLIAVEKEIQLAGLKKRCDIIVYKNDAPCIIVECKEMDTQLNQLVLDQVVRYNMALPVKYLVVTNGLYSYAWQRTGDDIIALNDLPGWNDL